VQKNNPDKKFEISENPVEVDYYLNEKGQLVFTEAYHLKRGYCCSNGCLHCPYGLHTLESHPK